MTAPVRRSVARITPRNAITTRATPAPAPPRTRSTPWPIQRPRAPASDGPPMPMRPSSATIATALPSAARVPARHSGVRHRRMPVRMRPATPIQAPTPKARTSASCTGPATAPPPGRSSTAAMMTPTPIAAIPVSSRRRSRWSSGGRGAHGARARGRAPGRRDPEVRLREGRVGAERAIVVNSMWTRGRRATDAPGSGRMLSANRRLQERQASRTSVPILHGCSLAETLFPGSDLGDQRQDERPPLGLLIEEPREALVDRPLPGVVAGVRREPRHERKHVLAGFVEERIGVVGDEPPRHEVGPGDHGAAGTFDRQDDEDHPVLRELLAIAKDDVTRLFDAESVDIDVPGPHPLSGDANPVLVDRDDRAIVDGEDSLCRDAHGSSQRGVQREVPVLAVDRDEVPRPCEREQELELLATRVPGCVHPMARGVEDARPPPVEVVDGAMHGLLVARY